MKKTILLAAAAVILTALLVCLSGCSALFAGGAVSGSDAASSADVSTSDRELPDNQDEDEIDVVITYHAIAASWETASDDAAYLAAARERLDEYTLLITSLGTMTPELAVRCDTVDDVRRDDAYMPLSAAIVQWSKNVSGYDSSALGEQAAGVHQKLTALAELTAEYIELFPSLCVSDSAAENESYLNDILAVMVELNVLV